MSHNLQSGLLAVWDTPHTVASLEHPWTTWLPSIYNKRPDDCHLSHANYSGLLQTFFALLEVTDSPHFTSPAAGGNETSQQVSDCEHDILTLISFEKWKKIS